MQHPGHLKMAEFSYLEHFTGYCKLVNQFVSIFTWLVFIPVRFWYLLLFESLSSHFPLKSLNRVVSILWVQFSSVAQSCPTLCSPMDCSSQASLSITNSQSPPKPMSIELVMPSKHLILCHPLRLLPSIFPNTQFSSVQSLSRVRLFATPWTAALQASLSLTNSRSLLKLMPIESVMPSSHLILCLPFSSCPQSLPASGSFPMSQLFAWGGQSIGVSASTSVLPMNTQDWSSLGWTGWISLQSKGLSRVFSNTTVQKHQFFSAQLSSQSNCQIHTWPLEKP